MKLQFTREVRGFNGELVYLAPSNTDILQPENTQQHYHDIKRPWNRTITDVQ